MCRKHKLCLSCCLNSLTVAAPRSVRRLLSSLPAGLTGHYSLEYFLANNTSNNKPITMSDAPKAKKASKPKAPAAHPKYSVMIAAAITALKDRTGSSRQAILKYVCANYKVDAAKAGQHLRLALKAGIKKGSLKMAKESGKGAGKFKLVKVEKPKKKPAAKKAATKKPKAKAAKKPLMPKPAAAKKPKAKAAKKPKAAKKAAPKKAAPKKK